MSPISPPRNLIKRTPQELEKLAWPDYPRRLDNLCCTWGGQYSDGFGPSVVGLGPEERVERNTFAGITVGRMGVVEEIVEVEGVERKGSKERGRKKGVERKGSSCGRIRETSMEGWRQEQKSS
jgi:hypothetical protein